MTGPKLTRLSGVALHTIEAPRLDARQRLGAALEGDGRPGFVAEVQVDGDRVLYVGTANEPAAAWPRVGSTLLVDDRMATVLYADNEASVANATGLKALRTALLLGGSALIAAAALELKNPGLFLFLAAFGGATADRLTLAGPARAAERAPQQQAALSAQLERNGAVASLALLQLVERS